MATSSVSSNALRPLRLPRIIELLRSQPLPAEVMLPQLNLALRTAGIAEVSIRTLQHDLEWLLENLGEAGIERVARAELKPAPPLEFHRYRIFYRLIGAEDLIPITADLVFLSEMEALAPVAARALLATPATPGVKDTTAGPLVAGGGRLPAWDGRRPDYMMVGRHHVASMAWRKHQNGAQGATSSRQVDGHRRYPRIRRFLRPNQLLAPAHYAGK